MRTLIACSGSEPLIRSRTASVTASEDWVSRKDPVVVIAGDIVDMDLPRHGKERVGVLFAEVPDFRSDVMFGEIHSCVQDKTAGTPAEQFADEVREPSRETPAFPFRW